MSRVLPVLVLMVWSAAPAAADDAKRTTPDQIITALHDEKFSYEKDLRTTPFQEVLDDLEKSHKVRFIISKAKFGDDRAGMDTMKAEALNTKSLDGMSLHGFLKAYMAALPLSDITYVVRADHIEITTRTAAQEEAGLDETPSDDSGAAAYRPNLPLICVAAREKKLSAVLDDLRRIYGVNVVVETAAKPLLKTVITEQLLNVPADTALELLAGQADLTVVRKKETRSASSPTRKAEPCRV